ncbi:MAG: sulfite exporter TauE/SafE family protein [Inhella sp.]
MSIELLLGLALLGTLTGFLAGLLGIGGGMVLVPALSALLQWQGVATPLAVKMAIATAMACIAGTSLSSLRAHHRRGAVRWPVVASLAPGVLLGGLLSGAALFGLLRGQWLAALFSGFVLLSAWQMWSGAQAPAERSLPPRAGLLGVGLVIGLLSGLVGAGGGFLTVPFLSSCAVPIHQAVASSAALGFPIALASTLGYVWGGWSLEPAVSGAFGYLYLPALAVLLPCTMLTAPLGARAAHALPVQKLKRGFALLLLVLAADMARRSLSG